MIRHGFYNVAGKTVSTSQVQLLQNEIHARISESDLLKLPQSTWRALLELGRLADVVQAHIDTIVQLQMENAIARRRDSKDSATSGGRRRSRTTR